MKTVSIKTTEADRKWWVVDLEGQTLGRAAARIAAIIRGKHKATFTPNTDTGDFVVVVNVEKVQFTGKKLDQKEYQDYSHYAGGQKITSAKEMLARKPEEIIRRAVKRMMPRGPLGYKQLAKLKLYAGNQHPHQAQQPQELKLK